MPIVRPRIAPCLWFDDEAEAAARFYVSVFPNSAVGRIARYGKAGHEVHGRPEGSIMTVAFTLDGIAFTALNGGPHFSFNEAVSLQVLCDTQDEVDHYWARLSDGGAEGPCGWLKDRFGLSWQITPRLLGELLADADRARADRVMAAMLKMGKLDIDRLRRAD